MASAHTTKHDVEDSASSPTTGQSGNNTSNQKLRTSGKKKGGKNMSANSNAGSSNANVGKSNSQAIGFAEGNSVLTSYNLGISGRKERILSQVKSDKYFHMVETAWHNLVDAKPYITERFSYPEFRHVCALMLYQRLEHVKFDSLGIKPPAPVRIPLPRNTRVFQPIWSVLANIGRVDDEDLRVSYIPDGALPKTSDLSDPDDVEGLLACTLYDWESSWREVRKNRDSRKDYDERIGYEEQLTHTKPNRSREELIKAIAEVRSQITSTEAGLDSGALVTIGDKVCFATETVKDNEGRDVTRSRSDSNKQRGEKYPSVKELQSKLASLYKDAKAHKAEMIRPKFEPRYQISSYQLTDGVVTADPGAYGAWLHWDPRLWLEYEQIVEIVSGVAMFSLSMPAETTGTYAWLLPVESRSESNDIFCKLPRASIAPATWILSLLLQSCTLSSHQRANFYCESDRLVNLHGLRQRYIRAAIKHAPGVEQYGTY